MAQDLVLVLNASYLPLCLVSWRRAVYLLWSGDAVSLADTDKVVRSAKESFKVPSIIKRTTNEYHPRSRIRLTPSSLFARDGHICQYCGKKFPASKLNMDHVIPQSRGGRRSWTNMVTSCVEDNNRKANRTPEEAQMKLIRPPQPPHWTIYDQILQKYPHKIPSSWKQFIPNVGK